MSKPATQSILFVCNFNTIRSPMAEALARHHFGDRLHVQSAGLAAGLEDGAADPFVAAALDEQSVPVDHEPQALEELEDFFFDRIVTLTPRAHHRALEWTRSMPVEVEYWPVPDPTATDGTREQRMVAYRETRDYLARRIEERFGTEAHGQPSD